MGHISIVIGSDYLHRDYKQLINDIHKRGYLIVWITMKPSSYYLQLKNYIAKHVNI